MHPTIQHILSRLQNKELTRILAFGSSNTGRFLPGMHWFDCLDLALHQQFGRFHRCINTGIGGNTSQDLLSRFEEDAAFYKPHLVFLTVGGNDSKVDGPVSIEEFEKNLHVLHERFTALETKVIFQTYYAPMEEGSEHIKRFYAYEERVRKVAAATGSALIDHLKRWDRLKASLPEMYLPLMRDNFHVTPRGNKVLGVDIARAFGVKPQAFLDYWGEAFWIQRAMDALEKGA